MRQWIQVAHELGAKYAILTAKYMSGFCLWDAKDYDYDVTNSGNKTDVVAAFVAACKEYGLEAGFYYCILDPHNEGKFDWDSQIPDHYFGLELFRFSSAEEGRVSMRRPIVVVGSINLDLVCTSRRIPLPGETIQGQTFQMFHGGKGANQAVGVARLGCPVSMAGKVGDDDFGKRLRQGLRNAGVNVRAVSIAKGAASGVALISVDSKGQNSIVVVPGANGELLPCHVEKSLPLLRSAGILLTQLEMPMETVEYVAAVAQRFGIPLMLDPAPARPLPRKLLRQVAYLTPNETETCTLCGLVPGELTPANVEDIAASLLSGAANIIVKMGRHGAYVAAASGLRKMIPAFKVKAIDSTAAGDAFNAGVAAGLMRGMDLVEAVRFGAAAGALSTTRAGAQPSMPTLADVMKLLATQNGKMQRPKKMNPEQRGPFIQPAPEVHSVA